MGYWVNRRGVLCLLFDIEGRAADALDAMFTPSHTCPKSPRGAELEASVIEMVVWSRAGVSGPPRREN